MPYSGKSQLALAVRLSAFTVGIVYGATKLSILKSSAAAQQRAAAAKAAQAAHH